MSTNVLAEPFADGRFFRIDSFYKGSNFIDVGVSWSPLFFTTGSVVNLYGRAGSLTNESELIATGEIDSLTLTNLLLSVVTPLAETNAAFFRLSSPCDTDGDGFPDSAELVLNTNPSDDEVPSVEVVSANMSRCVLTGPFAVDSTNGLSGAVFCRTIPMPRSSTWTQYFLTAGTGSAGLSGLRISYWDQNGHT